MSEIAQRCQTSDEMVLEARALGSAHRAASLDAPVDDEHASTRLETVAVEDDGFGRAESTADLDRLLPASRRASSGCCGCASTRTSPSGRSPTGSASPRCTSHG